MTSTTLDLIGCATERIHVPGAIQPHGWFVSTSVSNGALVAYSDNWPALVGGHDGALTRVLAEWREGPLRATDALVDGGGPASLGVVALAGRRLQLTAHRAGDCVNLEFEAAEDDHGTRAPIYTLARELLPRMQPLQSVEALCDLVAVEMKRLTGFGRCLVYRFDEEGNGRVLAEALDPGYASYLHHRFPASDIPPQARDLYRVNHIRLIPDANYVPVPIRFEGGGAGAAGFDLTQASLRSVSPIHLEYMRNMGTLASMSVSIMVRGELWGLVSCHDANPHWLAYRSRIACEHLGQLLSLQIEAKEDNERVSQQLELRQLTLQTVAHLADSDASLQRLVGEPVPLLRIAGATGAAVVLDDACWVVGDAPDPGTIARLCHWLAGRIDEEFHTDRLSAQWPEIGRPMPEAAGVLAISISQVHRHYILWFRPEIVQTIEWAGDPRKEAAADADGVLHPRRSFATWHEQVRDRSLPFQSAEVGAALELRQALIGIVLRRAEEMAELAGELGRANKELEAFSYTVSHDLRAPMRHIAGYVDLVLDIEGPKLTDRARRYLAHVKDASSFAGQLVDALLDFSRMGRTAMRHVPIDGEMLVDGIVGDLRRVNGDRRIEWSIERPLRPLWGDPILLQVAVRNLLDNAVKYTRSRPVAQIRVRSLGDAESAGLEVADNGVGFDMKYVAKLFGVFQRLHSTEEFEGTGIGLASVRRIVERHGGATTVTAEPGRGATFGFTIPANPPAPETIR